MKRYRVAVVLSHPIQHFCPAYCSWTALPDVELRVFFASKHGLTPYADKNFGRTIQWPGLKMNFPHEFLFGADEKAISRSLDAPDLEERLVQFNPDVLVVYGYIQAIQRRALRWSKKANVPVLMFSDSELRYKRGVITRLAKRVLLPRVYRNVSLCLSIGDANETYYGHYGVRDSQLVRCFLPIDRNHYDARLVDKPSARNRVRMEHGIPENHYLLLNVGKLVPWKRQRDLVILSNRVQGKRDDVTVVLAGTGRDETELRALCSREGPGGVIFAGFIPSDVLCDYYLAADIYVHCSEKEPHSVAVTEAGYSGLPIIISDRCGSYGPTDDVQSGLNGFVYGCGDVDQMLQRVLHLIQNPELRSRMSEASHQIGSAHQDLAHGAGLLQAITILEGEQTLKIKSSKEGVG